MRLINKEEYGSVFSGCLVHAESANGPDQELYQDCERGGVADAVQIQDGDAGRVQVPRGGISTLGQDTIELLQLRKQPDRNIFMSFLHFSKGNDIIEGLDRTVFETGYDQF